MVYAFRCIFRCRPIQHMDSALHQNTTGVGNLSQKVIPPTMDEQVYDEFAVMRRQYLHVRLSIPRGVSEGRMRQESDGCNESRISTRAMLSSDNHSHNDTRNLGRSYFPMTAAMRPLPRTRNPLA
ncbi:hypothetical protein BCR43DRAFT_264138 [Syncephalastrum racemosum]|uniref:Uncharacterized protein n=1 Tax=Syncephalastrum racemosum TaxID=13706 RepID=A0A1X2HGY2_SYNRA|nr:hypothetical protein BCR43DRAFT_264138 [Syncephalastrum racemosum]